jgi:hypothetical protein
VTRRGLRRAGLGATLLVACAALGLLTLCDGGSRSGPFDSPAREEEPQGAAPTLAAAPPRPTAPAGAPAAAPAAGIVETDLPTEPGSIRITTALGKSDGGSALVTFLLDGKARGTCFFHSSLFPRWTCAGVEGLGAHARMDEAGALVAADSASFVLTGLEPGMYGFVTQHRPRGVPPAAISVDLPPGGRRHVRLFADAQSTLVVRVKRAGEFVSAWVRVVWGDHSLASEEVLGLAGKSIVVPAGVPLDVDVSKYAGQEEYPPVPAQTHTLLPGETKEIVVELPAGTLVHLRATGREASMSSTSISVWRLAPGAQPRYVPSAVRPEGSDLRTWSGRLPEGTYALHAGSGAWRAWRTFDVVAPGPIRIDATFVPIVGRGLTLRWLDAAGAPVAGLRGTVTPLSAPLEDAIALQFRTDAYGRAELPAVPDGEHLVRLYAEKLSLRLRVDGSTPSVLELRLPAPPELGRTDPGMPSADIRAKVKTPEGADANGVVVVLERPGSPWGVLVQGKADGHLWLDRLVPGEATLLVPSSWYVREPYRTESRPLRLVEGTNELEVRLQSP